MLNYPAKWDNLGVLTFIIYQEGRVYENNLGDETEKIASEMTTLDPDETYKKSVRSV
ncbi:MAG: DUF2950 family protein [Pyrinomonadaceae bacterium]|nr:DUF2950 family protein [Pyrinomonadaceae bacterium]